MNFFKKLLIIRKKKEIVFFSEGKYQWKFFQKFVCDILSKTEKKVLFITSDKDDHAFNLNHKNLEVIYIGKGFLRMVFLSFIHSKILITSTPDLGASYFKKSPFVNKYIYIPHSIGSTHLTYKEKAFDNFETIFCVGENHIKEIQERERKFNLKKKELIKFGYPYLKILREEYLSKTNKNNNSHDSCILYAPSWGEDSSLEYIDLSSIEFLAQNYKVLFKPHPMSFQKNKKSLEKITKKFEIHNNFELVNSSDNQSLFSSGLLITDWSGISFEFFFLKDKPKIIFLDTPIRAINDKYKELGIITLEEKFRSKMGLVSGTGSEQIINAVKTIMKTENLTDFDNKGVEKKILFDYNDSLSDCLKIVMQDIKTK